MKITKLILLLCAISLLQGCMNAAFTGAQAVYGRHGIQSTLSDQTISMKAERAIYLDTSRFENTNVSVSCFNGVVLISGQVENNNQRQEIEAIVKKIPGVKEIHNATTLSSPSSALTRVSDTWITTKVKAKLIAMNDIDPSQIKVITENGMVYLMGIVPPEQAGIAVDLARTTEGVQGVVKVFSYIHISKA
ncbi:MAG TPA: BON domain-containing protein [Gammaproteobacteria bacterium]|nr:BON domain-containing protein [Gammaproteobacteria bacterium]